MEQKMNFLQKVTAVQSELKAPKSQYNAFGKYNYRNQEDILEAVKPILKKYDLTLVVTDEIKELAGLVYVSARAVLSGTNEQGQASSVETTAQAGIDPNRKGMDIAQSFGSSSSYARKYALNGLFLIDDTKDADATNDHGKGKAKAAPAKATNGAEQSWLNKNTPEFDKAVAFVKGGGDIAKIKAKYKISKAVMDELSKA
jgi:hypothetical protein